MKIYLVTKEKQEAERCGMYKDFYCYIMNFRYYREKEIQATIFATAKQALNYMLRNGQ